VPPFLLAAGRTLHDKISTVEFCARKQGVGESGSISLERVIRLSVIAKLLRRKMMVLSDPKVAVRCLKLMSGGSVCNRKGE
jgi:hypothetical protein